MIDTAQLKLDINILNVVTGKLGQGKKQGANWLWTCPFHSEKTPSFNVIPNKGIYKCFGCGKGGDAIDFLMNMGATFPEAVAELQGEQVNYLSPEVQKIARKKPIEWKQIPLTNPPKDFTHYQYGEPTRVWAYRDADGKPTDYIVRFDPPGEKKQILPLIYATDGKRSEWRWQGSQKPRNLYNLHLLAARPEKTVLIVEGEKCADKGTELLDSFDKVTVTTWKGGSSAIQHADWTPLYGRRIILFPDNNLAAYKSDHQMAGQIKPWHEQVGNRAMLDIAAILAPHCEVVKWVDAPEGSPDGWDIADAEWTAQEARAYLSKNLKDVPKVPDLIQAEEPTHYEHVNGHHVPPEPPSDLHANQSDPRFENEFFRYLGYSSESGDNTLYFFQKKTDKIVTMSPSGMSAAAFMNLAPLHYWETNFPGKSGFAVNSAINSVMRTSEERGAFTSEDVRGRGAWMDGKDIVLHIGDKLLVNDRPMPLGKVNSRYVYECARPLAIGCGTPIGTASAREFLEMIKILSWEQPIDAYLLAGWCVLAPVCGALEWRPHVWITGGAGTGKSWIMQKIIKRILGESGLTPQGAMTSEAGIRQALSKDARPVIFDEAEGEDKTSQETIQKVLNLMRLASSADGGTIMKGTASGTVHSYVIKACFVFASIAVQLQQQADKSRVSVLTLVEEKDKEVRTSKFERLRNKLESVVTDEYVRGLQSRTIALLPTILQNARTFSDAAASVLGSARAGDQIGTLLAGAFTLTSNSVISYEKALEWVKEREWSDNKPDERNRDELRLFSFLMESPVTIETDRGRHEFLLAELLQFASGWATSQVASPDLANSKLRRMGFKVELDAIIVSNTAEWIRKRLEGTPWAKNHHKILMRLDGARSTEAVRFASGLTTRAVCLPMSLLT